MLYQPGRVDLIAWQARPHRETLSRPSPFFLVVLGLGVASAILLALRFMVGLSMPLGLLQTAFAIMLASSALLLIRAAVFLVLRLQDR